nr:uncharacterized protein LOC127314063 [Lolium perenne]
MELQGQQALLPLHLLPEPFFNIYPGLPFVLVAGSPPSRHRAPQAFASSRIGSRSGVVRYDKFSGCSSASFNRYEDMFDEDDASKVTLPAWPRQGYGRHWLSSGL